MSSEYLFEKINILPRDCITITELPGTNPNADTELIIIPGFSDSSYEQNYKTLFVNYNEKISLDKFKKIHLVKFVNNQVRNLHLEIFNNKETLLSDALADLENFLYKKCGEILFDKLDKNTMYSLLAKSAGAGPAVFMCNTHPGHFKHLSLFAPGVKFINKSINKVCDNFPKTIVGWNASDTKVRLVDVWFKLNNVLPNNTSLHSYYFLNSSVFFDTQHEINTAFFENII
jgi:hypothetical protein